MEYKYCPKCAEKLARENVHDQRPLRCQNVRCRFIFWHAASPTVAVVIEDEEGRILLTRRNIEPDKGKLDLPGGFMNRNEAAQATAVREIREELGVDIEVGEFILTVPDSYYYQDTLEPTLNIAFAARIIGNKQLAIDPREIAEVVWIKLAEIDRHELAFANNERVLKKYGEMTG